MSKPSELFDQFHGSDYVYEYLYPYPLADLYRRYRVSRDPVDKLGYLLAASEASVKLLLALALALGGHKPEFSNTLASLQRQLKTPSFGSWRDSLRLLAPDSSVSSTYLEKALSNCIKEISGAEAPFIKYMRVLIERRNDYVHGSAITADTALSILGEVLPVFQKAFQELGFLARTFFIICEEVHRIRRPACFETIVRHCKGCNPVFPYEALRLNEPIDPKTTYIIEPDMSKAYSLHPVINVVRDDKLGVQRFYFYHKHTRKTVWQSYEIHKDNQVFGSPELEEEMQDFFDGQIRDSIFELNYYSGTKPAWSISLALEANLDMPQAYKMLGRIGEGRYGIVYRVLHTGLNEIRALKILRPEVAQNLLLRKRFEIEAQAIARLRNKHVAVELYEYNETPEGLVYLVLQFVEEGSLEEAMLRWGKKPWLDVLEIGLRCFQSLEKIHNSNILHRDIKLSNILVSGDSYLFCDFGVGKLLESDQLLTSHEDMIGTLIYMAPEQQKGKSDVRSDLYSLGICLVHLLAGQRTDESRQWLYHEYGGDEDFRNALLNIIEPIAENRPPNAAAVVERFASIKERARKQKEREGDENLGHEAIIFGALQPELKQPELKPMIWRAPDGTVFRRIPPGEFIMGGTKFPDERPVHSVRFIKPFYMASTLVTNGQFSEFCQSTKYRGKHKNFLLHSRRDFFVAQWKNPNSPVVFISWRDAVEYVLWKSEKEDRDYRLPTEAQWEYACRAGTRTVYYWGNTYDVKLLNSDERLNHTTPVGTFPPNPWGLFDMLGNVWEWCQDYKEVKRSEESLFYRKCANMADGTCIDPVNADPNPVISKRAYPDHRVIRGGSWYSKSDNSRPANRRGQFQEDCLRSIGLRLVLHDIKDDELEYV